MQIKIYVFKYIRFISDQMSIFHGPCRRRSIGPLPSCFSQVQAMKYFRLAADQGHPHAAYNLAVGHLQGIETDVMPGEAHHLIR